MGKLFICMCLCSPSSINWYRPKGGDAIRLGIKCRSGVVGLLVMRHRLSGISTYELNGIRRGGEHPAYTQLEYGTFTFTLMRQTVKITREVMMKL